MKHQSFDLREFEQRKLKFYALKDQLNTTLQDDNCISLQGYDFEDIDERVEKAL